MNPSLNRAEMKPLPFSLPGRADAEEQPLGGLWPAPGRHHSALRLAEHGQQLRLSSGRRWRRPQRTRRPDPLGNPPPPSAAATPSASGTNETKLNRSISKLKILVFESLKKLKCLLKRFFARLKIGKIDFPIPPRPGQVTSKKLF